MLIYFQSITCDALSLLLLVFYVSIDNTRATSSSSFTNDDNNRRAEEYVMTSAPIDGIKRSNVCGDGYRIEGALLKSYPYSKSETYLPYEDCSMTFQARRSNSQIRIRIVTLDLNDIHGGTDCLDSLRFYKSAYLLRKDKLDSVECGKITEAENFSIVSPTGIVTAHFSTDGGNVSGLGFKVVLTAFRYPNKTHQCDRNDEEFRCTNGECISSLLVCDGVAHCLDGSDEVPNSACNSNAAESLDNNIQSDHRARIIKHQQWRGISIVAFLLIIFIAFTLFMAYFVCRRCVRPPMPLINAERKNYSTIVKSRLNGPKSSPPTTQIVLENDKSGKHLDDDYNFL